MQLNENYHTRRHIGTWIIEEIRSTGLDPNIIIPTLCLIYLFYYFLINKTKFKELSYEQQALQGAIIVLCTILSCVGVSYLICK
jgi:hypothetical protein